MVTKVEINCHGQLPPEAITPSNSNLSEGNVHDAVERAKAQCADAGVRWTPARERALELLLQAGVPVKAYDLIDGFKADGATTPPTVYRSLDALVDAGLAHRIPSLNAFVACRHPHTPHAASFLICDLCRSVEEVTAPREAILAAFRESSFFRPSGLVVEIYGRCERCQR
jgi:Fur family zinc uptake transcriptional regulator